MKTATTTLITFLAAIALMTGTQGCYTQVGTTRDEEVYRDDDEALAGNEARGEEDAEDADDTEEAEQTEEYGQDWDVNARIGFDYYYPYTYWPSVSFSMAYNDPWYGWYDPYYSYGYPYYRYNYGYGYPSYGYGYGYNCGYYYPPGYYYGAPVPVTNRTFGSTRGIGGSGTPRGMTATGGTRTAVGSQGVNASGAGTRSGMNDPQHMDLRSGSGREVVGGMSGGGSGTGKKTGVNATGSSRKSGTSRKAVTDRVNKSLRGSSTSKDNKRLYRDRGSVSGSTKGDKSRPSVEPNRSNPSGGTSRTGGTRPSGNTPSTRPSSPSGRSSAPPPSAAPKSSPPPSSGGGASRGGGGGGGGSRTPRP